MDNAYGFVYITENMINHKKYIGQKKYDKDNSWETYLGSGTLLRRAVAKYGKENFSRTIIDRASTRDELNEKEMFWIKFYNATGSHEFYNIASGGTGGDTVAGFSKEEYRLFTEKRIKSVLATVDKRSGDNSVSAKLNTQKVLEIIQCLLARENRRCIADKYNVSQSTINDIYRHATWKNLTKDIVFPDVDRKSMYEQIADRHKKQVIMFDREMNYIAEYASIREAADNTGIGNRLISRVCCGNREHTHGYVFKFKNAS